MRTTMSGAFAMLGCIGAVVAGCREDEWLRALEADKVSVGEQRATGLNLRDCLNADCAVPAPEPKAVRESSKGCSVSELEVAHYTAWDVRNPMGAAPYECGTSCEFRGIPEIATAADGSLWVVAGAVQGGTISTNGRVGGTSLLLLVHHAPDGRLLGSEVLDRDDTAGVSYNPQLVVLEDGRLTVSVVKVFGPVDSEELRAEAWLAEFDAEGRQVGGRTALSLRTRDLRIRSQFGVENLQLAAAGGQRVALAQHAVPFEALPGSIAMLDMNHRTVSWVQTRDKLPSDVFGMVASGEGEVSLLSSTSWQESDPFVELPTIIEHYDAAGGLRWTRAIQHEGTGVGSPALSVGPKGDVIYAAIRTHIMSLPTPYRMVLTLHQLDSSGQLVRSATTTLVEAQWKDIPFEATTLQRAAILDDGSMYIPIGNRTDELPDGIPSFGSAFVHIEADGRSCHLFGMEHLELLTLKAAPGGALYFVADRNYGLLLPPAPLLP